MRKPDDPALCPSATAAPGALLIGVVDEKGRVSNVVTPLTIDEAFVEVATLHGPLGKRFRFSAPCQEGRCGHWQASRCTLIGKLHSAAVDAGEAKNSGAGLIPCAIRSQCRWWQQRGREACSVCPVVVTDQQELLGETAPDKGGVWP
jgi:hypothetical protein